MTEKEATARGRMIAYSRAALVAAFVMAYEAKTGTRAFAEPEPWRILVLVLSWFVLRSGAEIRS